MANYYKFSRKHFEFELKGILIRNRMGFMQDITEEMTSQNEAIWERVYKISTKNKSVDIILFSSIDIRTNEVRDNGADRVRVVLRWTTKNGVMYKRIHHHNRLQTLFKNLENTISTTQKSVFDLKFNEFTKSEEAV